MKRLTKYTVCSATAIALFVPIAATAQTLEADEVIPLSDWAYDDFYDGGRSIEEFIDEVDVHDMQGEQIGDIENVLISPDGQVLSIIAEVGGFWDIGDTHVNVPWDEVEFDAGQERVTVPVTEATVDDYASYPDEMITETEASTVITPVDDDPGTGARVWRATELIGDYVRLREGEEPVNYGYVDDIIVRDGQVAAVMVRPGVGRAAPGAYGYPYYGYGYGWEPGLPYYDLPYQRNEVDTLEPVDYEQL